jgi:hypothetical protein
LDEQNFDAAIPILVKLAELQSSLYKTTSEWAAAELPKARQKQEKLRDRVLQIDPLLPSELIPRWRRWLSTRRRSRDQDRQAGLHHGLPDSEHFGFDQLPAP